MTPSHPDAVFGRDIPDEDDVLIQLVDRLKTRDVTALSPAASSKLAVALAAASRRIVDDYTSLCRDRERIETERAKLTALRLELETREAAVTARETLFVMHPTQPEKRRRFLFWK